MEIEPLTPYRAMANSAVVRVADQSGLTLRPRSYAG
jgi:hypothetical protein